MSENGRLRHAIDALDFSVLEIELFLDTHPYDRRAIKVREQYRSRRRELIDQYERVFGPYTVTADTIDDVNHWVWVDGPWPWDYCGEMK